MASESDLADLLRAQSQMLEAMRIQNEKLSATVDMLVSRTPGGAVQSAKSRLTFAEVWEKYSPTMKQRAWWPRAEWIMVAPLAHFGGMIVADLRRSDWDNYRDNVRGKSVTQFGKSPEPGTLNGELKRIKAMLNWAVQEEIIDANPFRAARRLNTPKGNKAIGRDRVEAIKDNASPFGRALILSAVDSGMRIGELRVLEWSWIDLRTGSVDIPWNRTKTRKGRQSRLSERALDAIRMLPRVLGSPFVFANPRNGKAYTYWVLWRHWRDAVAESGIESNGRRVKFHGLRHQAISNMLAEGVPLFTAMTNAGHSSPAQTWEYTTVTDDDLDDLKEKIDAANLRGPRRGPRRVSSDLAPRQPEIVHAHKKGS